MDLEGPLSRMDEGPSDVKGEPLPGLKGDLPLPGLHRKSEEEKDETHDETTDHGWLFTMNPRKKPCAGLWRRIRSRTVRTLCGIVLCLSLSACAARPPGTIEDLEVLPQDAEYYLKDSGEVLIAPHRQAALFADFLDRFYAPWHRTAPRHTAEEVFRGLERYQARIIYGENLLPLSSEWLDEMRRASNVSTYPSLHLQAVSVVHASMRVLPTHQPVFYRPSGQGTGFPFDLMQNSLVPAGTPLLVTHAGSDGAWALVETEWAAGWVRWHEIALVDRDFITAYTSTNLAGFLTDRAPVMSRDGRFLVTGRVGMALPLAEDPGSGDHWSVRVPTRDHLGQARIREGVVPRTHGRRLPMPATAGDVARILNALMGQNYGWGGLYENRDCSALIQDVFAGFGLSLPRNSRDQAGAGRWISLKGLTRPEKEQRILRQGRPFLTILAMPGHVMLYIGADPASGRAVACHAVWGLRTTRWFRQPPGRKVLGKVVITSLEPGRELLTLVRPDGLLLERLTGMVLLD